MSKPRNKKKKVWSDDPVIQEVREARAELWEEAGGTIEGLMRLARERLTHKRRSKIGQSGTRR